MTVMEPLAGDGEYPETKGIVKEKVPSGSWNVIVVVEEECVTPSSTTDQEVAEGSPDSVNVTV